MKKIFSLLLMATGMFTACQKEISDSIGGNDTGNDSTANMLIGDWNFLSMQAETQGITELFYLGISEKAVALFDYTTENNKGTISFTDSTMISNGISYTVSGTIKTYAYENGVLTDSLQTTYDTTYSVANEAKKYILVNADSVYFPQGGFSIASDTLISPASGARLGFSGNNLTLLQSSFRQTTQMVSAIE